MHLNTYIIPHAVNLFNLFPNFAHYHPRAVIPFLDLLELAIVHNVVELGHLFVD